MINRKLPAMMRDQWPIVSTNQQIVWFVGYQIDERVRVTENSESVVYLICRKMEK